ncbi:MAG: hypothetical protein JSV50_17790 [Desulfobacteraceae bacterium]|nr:MAG: hypothetical protein JSV50_17790 [Desulfobacteraceae bacterium]
MPETVSVDRELGIIIIESSQQVEADDLRRSLETVLQIAHDHGLNKILVDTTDQKSLPPIGDLFDFASELSSRARNLKHAIVVAKQSPEDLRFIETTAHNRGAFIQIFSSRDDAFAGLNQ